MKNKKGKSPTIISINGTKGKTTVARLLEIAYNKIGKKTLLVDTHGHYFNREKRSNQEENIAIYGLMPTVCPGRFLYELKDQENSVAILETSVGSSALPGMGYKAHNVGILTNIFEDHIGRRIKTRLSLAKEKGKLFRRVKNDGTLIFNADDKYSVPRITKARKLLDRKNVEIMPTGIDFSFFNIDRHLKNGGEALTLKEGSLLIVSPEKEEKVIDLSSVDWTFNGSYRPAVLNLMLAVSCIYKDQGRKVLMEVKDVFENYTPDEKNAGRMLCYLNREKNIGLIIDYAHEKNSLKEISRLASKLSPGKTTGVIRFAPDRTDEQLKDYSRETANLFDNVIVYDKIDGVQKKPLKDKRKVSYRDIGEVSKIVFEEMKNHSHSPSNIHRIVQEKDALKKAFELSRSGDLVIHIYGNDPAESVQMIKDIMGAERCSPKNLIESLKRS
ncbi:MAG: Mur ligase family protein [Patescibacteria group bacterium]